MQIKIRCRYYRGDRPCDFHKIDARTCKNCGDFAPIKERILIIKLGALGDVLRTTSILPAINKRYPRSHITWITRKEAMPLLENNRLIDRLLAVEENYLEYVLLQKYDISASLDLELLSAAINALSKAAVKMGFIADEKGCLRPADRNAEEWYGMSLNDSAKKANRKTYFEHIYRICDLRPPYFKPQYALLKKQIEFADNFRTIHKLGKFRKIIGINTGAGSRWLLKRWTLEHYIELIRLVKNKNPDAGILLYGGKIEAEFNKKIIEAVKDLIIDTGCNNSIEEFAALVSLSDIFLTPDTLGMHLSIALGKTTIVLVGPTSPWEIDVFGKGAVVYDKELDCICCYLSSCDKSVNCMNVLSPPHLLDQITEYLK